MYSALRNFVKRAAPAVTVGQHAATAPNVQSIWLNVCRGMATGPAAGGHISDELLDKLGSLSTQALIDGLWVMGWPTSHIMGARPLTEGQKKMIGRAITIQFAAARPDIAADKPGGTDSPEYEAFELVNGKEVIVMSSVGPWESVGGDIKFLRLFQRGVSWHSKSNPPKSTNLSPSRCYRSEFLPELATLSFETWLTRHNKLSISQSNPRRSLRSAPV